jgi:hypothetical protein
MASREPQTPFQDAVTDQNPMMPPTAPGSAGFQSDTGSAAPTIPGSSKTMNAPGPISGVAPVETAKQDAARAHVVALKTEETSELLKRESSDVAQAVVRLRLRERLPVTI